MLILVMANLTQQQIVDLFGPDAILIPSAVLAVVEKDFSVQVEIRLDNVAEMPYSVGAVNN